MPHSAPELLTVATALGSGHVLVVVQGEVAAIKSALAGFHMVIPPFLADDDDEAVAHVLARRAEQRHLRPSG